MEIIILPVARILQADGYQILILKRGSQVKKIYLLFSASQDVVFVEFHYSAASEWTHKGAVKIYLG